MEQKRKPPHKGAALLAQINVHLDPRIQDRGPPIQERLSCSTI